jgi:outer membrane protein
MKNVIRLIIIIAILQVRAIGQETISFKEAIHIAVNKNTTLVKSQNSLGTYSASLKNTYGNLLPSLELNAGWNWQRLSDDKGTMQLDYLGNTQSVSAAETDSRNYNLSIGGSVTLFDGLSTLKTISQKKNELASAKLDLEKQKQDVILQAINLFTTVINDESILKFHSENYRYNTDLLKKVKEMAALSMVTNADVSAQEYQTANAQLSEIQAENDYAKAKVVLMSYLSLDMDKDYIFIPDSTADYSQVDTSITFDSLCQTAFQSRSDYRSEKIKFENSSLKIDIAKSGYYPSLSGNYSFATSAVNFSDIFSRRTYGVGLSLNVPIFSHWSTETSVESANIDLKNNQEELSALEREIKGDIRTAVLELHTAKMQAGVTKLAAKSAKETWDIKSKKYVLGLTTFLEQQSAYKDFVQAENNQITSETNLTYKQLTLLNVLGLLKAD